MPSDYTVRSGFVFPDGYSVTFAAKRFYRSLPPDAGGVAAIMRWVHEGCTDATVYFTFTHLGDWLAIGRK